ncbi:heavy metal translocating P-type ATPase [Bacillus sp. FSL K6-3431]|uniref:heavy metal translocating P-type ATPase n=1 Tax=Bacillus sp. FSL K6-3431 TaxID=2921500 RepID=UPI0030F6D61E
MKAFPHLELIAAMTSGILILCGWLISRSNNSTLSIIILLFAFLIGGFAKAKEGIEETLKDKELNVEMLMIFAAIGSAAIGYWTEGAILIFIFSLSGALETYTMNKSHKEISNLMNIQPENALKITNGIEELVSISDLLVGDRILVKAGERIPADGKITKGHTTVNEATITGESIPADKKVGDNIFTGTVNLTGSFTAEVKKKSNDTLFHKIIELVQNAQSEKSPSQLFIEKFEGIYVKIVLLIVLLMMFLPHFVLGWSWTDTFYRAMILLVVASPCALVAAIMPASLSAISNGARNGILFKGGAHLENISNVKAIAFDKTGTLTKGHPEVTDFISRENTDYGQVLQIIASIENESNHPLAQAIVRYAQDKIELNLFSPDNLEDVVGWGVKAMIAGEEWLVGKQDFVGEQDAATFASGTGNLLEQEGKTIVFVKDKYGIVAMIGLKDVIRSETKTALTSLNKMGIKTIMLTGDSENTASIIAKEANLDSFIAECLPETKVNHLKQLKEKHGVIAMVGDGINDAPALATADVGIAMGQGSDIALETADVVLMKNELTRIEQAIRLSKKMNLIIKQNIIFSITVILILITSNFFALIDLPFGVIGHEGSTILVILNGLRLLRS